MKRIAFSALILAGVCWGVGFPLGKLALREIDAGHMVLLRFAVAAVCALPFALRSRATRGLFHSRPVLLAGVLYGVGFLVQFEGLARTSVTLAALLVGAMPALIAVAARLFGERVSRTSWTGVAAATLGAALIASKPGTAGTPLGVMLCLGALPIFLAWLFVSRRAPTSDPTDAAAPIPAMAVPAVTIIIAALTILPITLLMHGAPRLALNPGAWVGIVGQGVFSTLLATAAWQYGLTKVGTASAGVFINIEPLMGAALGVALFGDQLTAAMGAGGLLIIVGSTVVVLGERDLSAPLSPPQLADAPPA
jgi:drug/metabolite transporter (DMT)-like permease